MSQVASSSVPSGSGLSVREGINGVLGALMSANSGPSAPASPIPFMLWGDTSNNEVMIRNPSNTAWLRLSEQMGAVEYDRATALTDTQQQRARSNILSPLMPLAGNVVTAHGVSQWSLPPGGTWTYSFFTITDAGAVTDAVAAGVAAGGTQVVSIPAGLRFIINAWRIA